MQSKNSRTINLINNILNNLMYIFFNLDNIDINKRNINFNNKINNINTCNKIHCNGIKYISYSLDFKNCGSAKKFYY